MTYKILLVDDEPEIHTFIRISLTAEGFQYIGASSLEDARSNAYGSRSRRRKNSITRSWCQ